MMKFFQKNGVLLAILAVLSVIAAVSGTLFQGQLVTHTPKVSQAGTAIANTRSCDTVGTVFEAVEKIDDVVRVFQQEATIVTAEREKFLRSSSEWSCPLLGESGDPEMPALSSLAKKLPGWHYPYPIQDGSSVRTVTVSKPVPFEAFSSVLSELLREYECKLSAMQQIAVPLVLRNADSACTGADCPQNTRDIAAILTRTDPFYRRLSKERDRGRFAVYRTIETLRSFEMQYPITRDLLCFVRASLDLRAEMSLLADATSCMPKIWDAVTSLHDRAP